MEYAKCLRIAITAHLVICALSAGTLATSTTTGITTAAPTTTTETPGITSTTAASNTTATAGPATTAAPTISVHHYPRHYCHHPLQSLFHIPWVGFT